MPKVGVMNVWWTALGLLVLAGCADDAAGPGASTPVISNLQYSPSSVYVTSIDTPGLTVNGTVDFADDDGDLTQLRLAITGGADLTFPLQGLSGVTRGTLIGVFLIPPGPAGTVTLSVWVQDARGHRSNTLSGEFAIRIDDSGLGWTQRSTGTTVQFNRVVLGDRLLVAVGYGGAVVTSDDGGVSWTARSSGTDIPFWGLVYSGDRYVAVGEQGVVCTSVDGVLWTPGAATGSPTLFAVAWSGSRFLAVGSDIVSSTDGLVWRLEPAIPGVRELRAVGWADNRFVAAGTVSGDSTVVLTSPDGTVWTERARLGPVFPRDICLEGPCALIAGATGAVVRSTDGARWQRIETGALGFTGVCWSGNRFLAVGTRTWASADGSSWQQTSDELGMQGVVWASPRYVAVGFGGRILTSP